MDNLGFESRQGNISSSPKYADQLWGSPVLVFRGCRVCFAEVKLSVRETDHSSQSSWNEWSCTEKLYLRSFVRIVSGHVWLMFNIRCFFRVMVLSGENAYRILNSSSSSSSYYYYYYY